MHKMAFVRGVILSVVAALAIPVAHAQTPKPNIYEPDRGFVGVGIGYQYQHYSLLGRDFHTNGFNSDVSVHVVDWITGAGWRAAFSAEGTAVMGFGNTAATGGVASPSAKSLFIGGGPHLAIQSAGRIEPWIHFLPGWQHMRFTQTPTVGSNSAFGFMGGGGVDIKMGPTVYWRVQGDYIGTYFKPGMQSNYSVGSGVVFYFQ